MYAQDGYLHFQDCQIFHGQVIDDDLDNNIKWEFKEVFAIYKL